MARGGGRKELSGNSVGRFLNFPNRAASESGQRRERCRARGLTWVPPRTSRRSPPASSRLCQGVLGMHTCRVQPVRGQAPPQSWWPASPGQNPEPGSLLTPGTRVLRAHLGLARGWVLGSWFQHIPGLAVAGIQGENQRLEDVCSLSTPAFQVDERNTSA